MGSFQYTNKTFRMQQWSDVFYIWENNVDFVFIACTNLCTVTALSGCAIEYLSFLNRLPLHCHVVCWDYLRRKNGELLCIMSFLLCDLNVCCSYVLTEFQLSDSSTDILSECLMAHVLKFSAGNNHSKILIQTLCML